MTESKIESVLVVDDEAESLEEAARILEEDGFVVVRASSGFDAEKILAEKPFDLVITDLVMRGKHGFEVIADARRANPAVICIAMTSYGSLETALESLEHGAYSFQEKPLDPKNLLHCVSRGLEKQRLTKELLKRNDELEKLNRHLDAKVNEATRELQELNRRILTEMASLREVDQLKTDFLDNVTHDLRSPLTLIKGYIEFLLDFSPQQLSPESRECLESIMKASNHMGYLVGQLVDAAGLTSGKIELKPTAVPVKELLDEAAQLSGKDAGTKGLSVSVDLAGDPGAAVLGERGRLIQILTNLLGNACKFTPQGGSIRLKALQDGGFVSFSVEDTGPGIPPEFQERVFDKFFQINGGGKKEFKGLGLGLRIAKDLVTLHGGTISVANAPGAGARFTFTIPKAA